MVNPKGPTAEAIAAELGPRSPLVMEKAPQPVQGIRDPYRFPLDIGADAHASNQRNVKALQHANKTGLLPGLASTAWQTGDRGKAEVIELFHQIAAADAKGGSAHARNLEDRFLPMIPKQDKALFRDLRAGKEAKTSAPNADEIRVAETATERAFKDAGRTIGKTLGYRERGRGERTTPPTLPPPTNLPIDAAAMYKTLQYQKEGPGDFENAVLARGSFRAALLAREAVNETEKYFPNVGTRNTEADAFRHAYCSFRMAQELGIDTAKKIGDGHERRTLLAYAVSSGPSPTGETLMDLYNNRVGRDLFSATRERDPSKAAAIILDALRTKRLLQRRPFRVR